MQTVTKVLSLKAFIKKSEQLHLPKIKDTLLMVVETQCI